MARRKPTPPPSDPKAAKATGGPAAEGGGGGAAGAGAAGAAGGRVLIVSGARTMRERLAARLVGAAPRSGEGLNCVQADSACAAWEALEHGGIDVVVVHAALCNAKGEPPAAASGA